VTGEDVGKYEKIFAIILFGRNDRSIRFAELVKLLLAMGFNERIKGSHHIYYRHDIDEILNLQPKGAQAKAYQVKQVRNIILKYRLEEPNV
jgi:predicted RNA binding protein YcfA (HicA-like mRNA interferase family)